MNTTEKRKRKVYSRVMDALLIVMLLFFVNVLKHNPFLSLKDLIFTIMIIGLGVSNSVLTEIVENNDFFAVEDRQKRFIKSYLIKTSILIVCIIIIYVIFQVL